MIILARADESAMKVKRREGEKLETEYRQLFDKIVAKVSKERGSSWWGNKIPIYYFIPIAEKGYLRNTEELHSIYTKYIKHKHNISQY